ncbi:hypothetical protein [Marinifilum sp. D714]|nr:hypothetical protein [Marinifilum sp. D714]MDQ2180762.1 hypothetical protein [Marinifilum sp. D714]
MEQFQGGQIQNCDDFHEVIHYLEDNGHLEQSDIIWDLYYDQYCGWGA